MYNHDGIVDDVLVAWCAIAQADGEITEAEIEVAMSFLESWFALDETSEEDKDRLASRFEDIVNSMDVETISKHLDRLEARRDELESGVAGSYLTLLAATMWVDDPVTDSQRELYSTIAGMLGVPAAEADLLLERAGASSEP